MGLDMYAMATNDVVEGQVDVPLPEAELLHQWRKHPNLHGWMEALYVAKGGKAASFNCASVELTEADLARLETAIRAGDLPSTVGFFFGASDGSETEDDLAFVAKARAAIADGKRVFYDSWW